MLVVKESPLRLICCLIVHAPLSELMPPWLYSLQNGVLVQHKAWFNMEAFVEVSLVVRKENPKRQNRGNVKVSQKPTQQNDSAALEAGHSVGCKSQGRGGIRQRQC